MIGLERGVVRLVEYEASWADEFAREADRLRATLAERIGVIEHIGSTAIRGLVAKPIIDLMASVESLQAAEALVPTMKTLAYEWDASEMEIVPDRRFFIREDSARRALFHLSLASTTSDFWQRQILFRDYLRAHGDARDAYAELKTRLAKTLPADRRAYVDHKTRFVQNTLAKAREEGS